MRMTRTERLRAMVRAAPPPTELTLAEAQGRAVMTLTRVPEVTGFGVARVRADAASGRLQVMT